MDWDVLKRKFAAWHAENGVSLSPLLERIGCTVLDIQTNNDKSAAESMFYLLLDAWDLGYHYHEPL